MAVCCYRAMTRGDLARVGHKQPRSRKIAAMFRAMSDFQTMNDASVPSPVELSRADVVAVVGGGATPTPLTGTMFLRFEFKLVAVKTISWAHD